MEERQLHVPVGPELLLQVRAAFIKQGTSLRAWCIQHGIHRQNARDCLIGKWQGPKATQLRNRLILVAFHGGK